MEDPVRWPSLLNSEPRTGPHRANIPNGKLYRDDPARRRRKKGVALNRRVGVGVGAGVDGGDQALRKEVGVGAGNAEPDEPVDRLAPAISAAKTNKPIPPKIRPPTSRRKPPERIRAAINQLKKSAAKKL